MNKRNLHSKRALLSVLFTLLLSLAGVTNAFAQSFTVGDLNYSINDDGASVTLVGHVDGQNATGELVIPESVELYGASYPVTEIGNSAFYYCPGLSGSLVIPNSVINIGEFAFHECYGLTGSLTIGNAVQTIQMQAFDYCGFTGTLTIPEGVTYIGGGAFNGCQFTALNYNAINCSSPSYISGAWIGVHTLEALTIGENVQVIPNNFLRYCYFITGELVFPNSVTTIGENAFYYCGFTGSLIIPNSATTIGNSAFYGCNGFDSLTIGNSVTTICQNAFYGCSGFTGALNIPNSVTTIGNSAFYGCNGFDSLTIGNSVTSIGENAFYGCSSFMGSLTIPDAVTTIGNSAFMNCSGFSGTLTLGQSLTQIDNSAFFGACENFTSFNVLAEVPPTLGTNVFLSVNTGIPVYLSCGTLEAYQNASGWNNFTNFQETNPCQWVISATAHPAIGGTVSGGGIFEQGQTCTLTATPIGDFEFYNWTENGLIVSTEAEYTFTVTGNRSIIAHFRTSNSISFADPNVEAICVANWDTNGDGGLDYDEAIAVTDLGGVFRNNESITSFDELQYFTGLTTIGYGAFEYCSNLTSIVIPAGITSIGANAFYNCNSLTGDLSIPNSVTTIGRAAFWGCTGFTGNLILGNSLTWISGNAFYLCNFTGELTIPNSVEYIGVGAFLDCHGFTGTLTIGTGVTKIGVSAFRRCTGITAVQYNAINWQVQNGDDYEGDWYYLSDFMNKPIFNECENLVSVAIGEQVQNIPAYAFYHCSSLLGELTLPESLVSVGYYAFAGCDEITTINYNATNCTVMGSAQYPVFYDCISIQHINIGENVQSIPNYAFKRCFNVTDMSVAAVIPPTIGISTFATVSRSIPVSVPHGSGDAYSNAPYWEEFFNIIEVYFNDVQTVPLSQGWNWFSTYLDITLEDLKDALVEALPGTSITIKSRTQNTAYNPNTNRWRGTLNSLDVTQMYMISVDTGVEITLSGTPIDPAEHPVTISNGSNWIAFPLAESMTVSDAFAGFAVNGDKVKSRNGNSQYVRNRWSGGVTTLMPGQGYIFISNAQEDRILTFPTSTR